MAKLPAKLSGRVARLLMPECAAVSGAHHQADRALPVLDVVPAAHFGLAVADASWTPHLRPGELAVVDTADKEPQTGELFALALQSRAGDRLALVQPCRSALASRRSVAFRFGFGGPGAPGLVDGPLGLTGWARRCKGRVVGVVVPEPAFMRPGASVTLPASRLGRPPRRVMHNPAAIEPCNHRPPRQAPRREPEDEEVRARFDRAIFSLHVAYEVQAACGLIRLTVHDEKMRRGHRELADGCGDLPLVHDLRVGAARLIAERSCSHCLARNECPQRGRA